MGLGPCPHPDPSQRGDTLMEVSTSPVWQEARSAQTARVVHGLSVHAPRWHPVDGGLHSWVPCCTYCQWPPW